jgi:beta-glucanase (GH16 family)
MHPHLTRCFVRRAAVSCSVTCSMLCTCLAVAGPAAADERGDGRRGASVQAVGTLVALPPVVQAGRSPAAPPTSGQVVASFEPARPGLEVLVQRDTRRGWRTVATARQDRSGSAAFGVAPGVYRARTARTTRSAGVTTGRVRSRVWHTSFEDTFSGTALDTTVWNDQVRSHESVWAPRTCGRSDPAARRVADGILHLGVARDPLLAGASCSYSHPSGSGTHDYLVYSQVATEHTRFFRHGIFAARMKVQRARGMHSAFWMLPRDRRFVHGDPSAGTEVDVVEYFGERDPGADHIGSFVHYYDPGWVPVRRGDVFPAARRVLDDDEEWWHRFHVFSVEWTPDAYVFRVDGREYFRETGAVSLAEHYLVLSMQAVDYELDDLTPDEYDDSAQVDWVRVYDATSATSRPRDRRRASFRSRLHPTAEADGPEGSRSHRVRP